MNPSPAGEGEEHEVRVPVGSGLAAAVGRLGGADAVVEVVLVGEQVVRGDWRVVCYDSGASAGRRGVAVVRVAGNVIVEIATAASAAPNHPRLIAGPSSHPAADHPHLLASSGDT